MLPKIPIIRLPDSLDLPLPKYADGLGTTLTLMAAIADPIKIASGDFLTIPTGFLCALPLGVEAQIRSLPTFSEENPFVVLNAPCTIDASSRTEICVVLKNMGHSSVIIRRGQPIATLVFLPVLRIQWDEIKKNSGEKSKSNIPAKQSEQRVIEDKENKDASTILGNSSPEEKEILEQDDSIQIQETDEKKVKPSSESEELPIEEVKSSKIEIDFSPLVETTIPDLEKNVKEDVPPLPEVIVSDLQPIDEEIDSIDQNFKEPSIPSFLLEELTPEKIKEIQEEADKKLVEVVDFPKNLKNEHSEDAFLDVQPPSLPHFISEDSDDEKGDSLLSKITQNADAPIPTTVPLPPSISSRTLVPESEILEDLESVKAPPFLYDETKEITPTQPNNKYAPVSPEKESVPLPPPPPISFADDEVEKSIISSLSDGDGKK